MHSSKQLYYSVNSPYRFPVVKVTSVKKEDRLAPSTPVVKDIDKGLTIQQDKTTEQQGYWYEGGVVEKPDHELQSTVVVNSMIEKNAELLQIIDSLKAQLLVQSDLQQEVHSLQTELQVQKDLHTTKVEDLTSQLDKLTSQYDELTKKSTTSTSLFDIEPLFKTLPSTFVRSLITIAEPVYIKLSTVGTKQYRYVANKQGLFVFDKSTRANGYGAPIFVSKNVDLYFHEITVHYQSIGNIRKPFDVVIYSYHKETQKIFQHFVTKVTSPITFERSQFPSVPSTPDDTTSRPSFLGATTPRSTTTPSPEQPKIFHKLSDSGIYQLFVGIVTQEPIEGFLNVNISLSLIKRVEDPYARHFGPMYLMRSREQERLRQEERIATEDDTKLLDDDEDIL